MLFINSLSFDALCISGSALQASCCDYSQSSLPTHPTFCQLHFETHYSEAAARQELESKLEAASNDNAQLRRERKRLDEKLAHVHG